ncbi:nucleotide triphosphate diphosphatase NUDT15 [Exaiptasia diaphana]|uniref:Nucleotide triphosphate diphosphatase NUDT15 n=1 Tax=Exaiptasia diaphana TaxID=2652724 RepID=A0A913XI75_EXADI|nr:nucleotide triphosphate diphosphatase NUDT15 [Exaiptasia diaphana]KXJ25988.1 putative 8-oxo-dGTP diphosphatase NUDT15 [Exaiptasia diaphana]
MAGNAKRPKVGVGVFIFSPLHPGCVLIGKRKGSDGQGTYGLPGGHLEFGEEWHECAKREIFEETGLTVKNVGFAAVVNSVILKEEYHYITIFMKTEIDTENGIGEPINTEPDKCEGWEWHEWNSKMFPSPLFRPLQDARAQGYNPFET